LRKNEDKEETIDTVKFRRGTISYKQNVCRIEKDRNEKSGFMEDEMAREVPTSEKKKGSEVTTYSRKTVQSTEKQFETETTQLGLRRHGGKIYGKRTARLHETDGVVPTETAAKHRLKGPEEKRQFEFTCAGVLRNGPRIARGSRTRCRNGPHPPPGSPAEVNNTFFRSPCRSLGLQRQDAANEPPQTMILIDVLYEPSTKISPKTFFLSPWSACGSRKAYMKNFLRECWIHPWLEVHKSVMCEEGILAKLRLVR
jgi:hypothetical protein